MMLALEWADTVHRPRKLTHDPRKARPDAVNLPPAVRATPPPRGTAGQAPRGSAGGRAGPRMGRSSPGRTFRRWARPRGEPWVCPTAHQRLRALHPPRLFGEDGNGKEGHA